MKTKTKQTDATNSFDIEQMYNGVVAAEAEKSQSQRADKDYLKPKAGNTYLVKLVPYAKDVAKTFGQYDFHGWNSVEPGKQYVTTGACPRQHGGKCLVCEAGYDAYNRKEQHNGDLKSKLLLKRTTYLVNVYVIDDPVSPENNGTVKVLRYGPALNQKIHDALYGEDKEEFGKRVFMFSPDGVHLRITVERKGGNPKAPLSYEKSKFVSSAKLEADLEEAFATALQSAKDLTTLFPKTKGDAEILSLLDKHFHGHAFRSTLVANEDVDQEQDGSANETRRPLPTSNTTAADPDIDADVAALLEGLN